MPKKMLIDATHPEETRVVVVDGNKVEDFDFESINKRQLAGNIYLAKVTRVEPSLQAAFIDYGGNRHGFLAFAEVHPDYYQIPVADREALLAEEAREEQERRAREDDEGEAASKPRRSRRRSKSKDKDKDTGTAEKAAEAAAAQVAGLEVIDVLEADEIDAPRGLEIAEPDQDEEASDAAKKSDTESADASAADPSGEETTLDTAAEDVAETSDTDVAADDAETADQAANVETAAAAEEAASTEEAGADETSAEKADSMVGGDEQAPVETADADAPQADAEVVEVAEESDAGEATPSSDPQDDSSDEAPKTIAESAGLDDDDQISEEIPDAGASGRKDTANDDTANGDVATDADPDASKADDQSGPASDEPSEQAAEVQAEESPAVDDSAATPADGGEVAASDAKDAPGNDAQSAPADQSDATAEAAEPAKAEAGEQTAEGDGPAEDAEGDGRQKRSRRRRRRGSKKSEAKAQEQEETAKETSKEPSNGETDSDDDDEDVESVGADDTLEEAANARVRLRRKYKIQDVIRVRQILLVQVVKEERGNKGAALTTYLSLAGRYCVLMPNTARGGGISRKITNAGDRKRLREITGELEVPTGMGLIVRTAGAERTRAEIKRDYDFLTRQWEQIRELTLKSIAPTLIYEEGSLIKRSIRDIYSKEIDQIQVEGETGYREAKEYMKMLMPSHAKNVQPYTDPIPLFTRFQVESYLNGMFNPTVQLKSGGYIVIGVTEALVAIDVNSGRATKQGSIEETALQTNLEASDEVARQLRLRDLAGLIVIDYIDMDENRNNRAVEKRMKDRLKNDRARIQVGRISAFGLMEMSRQRLRPGMLEATTQPCPHCHGVGLIRSDDSLSLSILREVEEEGVRNRANEITVRTPVDVANFLVNHKREHIRQIEERHGIVVLVLGDPSLVSPNFEIDRAKTQSRRPAAKSTVISAESVVSDAEIIEDAVEVEVEAERSDEERDDGEGRSKRRRGRRGGRRKKNANGNGEAAPETADAEAPSNPEGEERRSRRGRGRRNRKDTEAQADQQASDTSADGQSATGDADTSGAENSGAPGGDTAQQASVDTTSEVEASTADEAPVAEVEASPAPEAEPAAADETPDAVAAEDAAPTESQPATAIAEPEMAVEPADAGPPKPKRRGWWSLGR